MCGEFQCIGDEVAKDLRKFFVVGIQARQPHRLLENQVDRRGIDYRAEHTAQRGKQIEHVEPGWKNGDAPSFYFCQIKQVIDHIAQFAGGSTDKPHLLVLLGTQWPVQFVSKQAGDAQYRSKGGAKFMAHVRQEAAFQI
ncbi:hypothetical protein D3C77_581730 [compost metagenome]